MTCTLVLFRRPGAPEGYDRDFAFCARSGGAIVPRMPVLPYHLYEGLSAVELLKFAMLPICYH